MLSNTDKDRMFFLLNKKNDELRRSENRMALRRAKRKMPKSDSLRIVEGDTLSKALKAEEKAIKDATAKKEAEKKAPKKAVKKTSKKEAPKKATKKEVKQVDKKQVKKAAKDHADKVDKTEVKKSVKKESVEAGSKTPSKVEAGEEKTPELF